MPRNPELTLQILLEIDEKRECGSKDLELGEFTYDDIVRELQLLFDDSLVEGIDVSDKDEKGWISLRVTSNGLREINELKNKWLRKTNIKLSSIKKTANELVTKSQASWFDKNRVLTFFTSYYPIRDKLKRYFPDAFTELPTRDLPREVIHRREKAGIRQMVSCFSRGDIGSLIQDIDYCLPLIQDELKVEVEDLRMKGDKIFIVHGHDEELKNQLELFLRRCRLNPIILERESGGVKTLIEKFEKYSTDVGYAFVLLTPDDIGYSKEEDTKPDDQRIKEYKARPNVLLELGFFICKLGRDHICCIVRDKKVFPSDIEGIMYQKVTEDLEREVGAKLVKEMKAVGINPKYPY